MLSVSLLLVCAAAALAVPLPEHPTPAPPAPPKPPGPVVEIDSKLHSAVLTGGGAQVTTSGSTSGAASITTTIKGPGVSSSITASGQGGISGQSATAGNSKSLQKGRSKTVVEATTEGTQVKTGTQGTGVTDGIAVATQKAASQGGVQRVRKITFLETDGKDTYQVEQVEQQAANSASGHQASSKGIGTFNVLNLGQTGINTPGLVALPRGKAPKPKPEPTPEPEDWKYKYKPEPTTTRKPVKYVPKKRKGLSAESKSQQAGKTTGLGAVTATGATQGAARTQTVVDTPNYKSNEAGVVQSGVGSTAVSSGDGVFKQKAVGKTVVVRTDTGAAVVSSSDGAGITDGAAGSIQTVATGGGFQALRSLELELPGLSIDTKEKASGTSQAGHKASSAGPGKFVASNKFGTEINLKTPELNLDTFELNLPQPPHKPKPTTTKKPKYSKEDKWG